MDVTTVIFFVAFAFVIGGMAGAMISAGIIMWRAWRELLNEYDQPREEGEGE
jgi:hypothetical protein